MNKRTAYLMAFVLLALAFLSACASSTENGTPFVTQGSTLPSDSNPSPAPTLNERRTLAEIVADFENAGFPVDMNEKPLFQMINAKDGVIFYIDKSPVKIYEFENEEAYQNGLNLLSALKDMPKAGLVVLDTNSVIALEIFTTGKVSTPLPQSTTPTPSPTLEPPLQSTHTPEPTAVPTPKLTSEPTTKPTAEPTSIDPTKWVPYDTSSLPTLLNAMAKGYVVYYDGQYWATPEYAARLRRPEVIHESTTDDTDELTINRYSTQDERITSHYPSPTDYDLDGIQSTYSWE